MGRVQKLINFFLLAVCALKMKGFILCAFERGGFVFFKRLHMTGFVKMFPACPKCSLSMVEELDAKRKIPRCTQTAVAVFLPVLFLLL